MSTRRKMQIHNGREIIEAMHRQSSLSRLQGYRITRWRMTIDQVALLLSALNLSGMEMIDLMDGRKPLYGATVQIKPSAYITIQKRAMGYYCIVRVNSEGQSMVIGHTDRYANDVVARVDAIAYANNMNLDYRETPQ